MVRNPPLPRLRQPATTRCKSGAFASDDKVREARDKLASAGIKSFVEKLDTREGGRTRVRAGPFATREAAESARERVRGLGFPDAAVVAR